MSYKTANRFYGAMQDIDVCNWEISEFFLIKNIFILFYAILFDNIRRKHGDFIKMANCQRWMIN